MVDAVPQTLALEVPGRLTRAFDSVSRILASKGLPRLSEDDSERNWIYVTGEPGFYYYGEFVEIDEAWIDNAIGVYEQLQARGYEAPVLAEHDSAVTDGLRLGDVVRLVKAKVEGRFALAAEVRWAIEGAHEKIQAGQIRYFSPAIAAVEDDSTGEVLEPVISELSVVAAPHQKSGTTHVLAKEASTMAEEEAGPRTSVEKRIEKLSSEVASIAGTVSALSDLADSIKAMTSTAEKAEIKEEEEEIAEAEEEEAEAEEQEEEEEAKEEVEVEVEMAEVKALKHRLGQLELQRDQAVYSQDLPIGSTIELTQGVADLLFGLWRKDRERFAKVVVGAMQKADQPQAVEPSSPWATMLGEAPVQAESRSMSDKELHALCLSEAGGDHKRASKLYYQKKYGV